MYFSYSIEFGFATYKTEKEARESAENMLDDYRDDSQDGWSDDVESVCWGKIIEEAVQFFCHKAPQGSQFDEICDYELKPVIEEAP